MASEKILLVEDDPIVASYIQDILRDFGYIVSGVIPSGEEALDAVLKDCPDLILMDIRLKDEMDGIETARQIQGKFDIPIVYMTAYSNENLLKQAKLTEPYAYLIKPVQPSELRANIEIALYKNKVDKHLKERKKLYYSVVANSLENIFLYDPETLKIIEANEAFQKTFGYNSEEIKNLTIYEIISHEHENINYHIQHILREGQSFVGDRKYRHKDGSIIDVEVNASLIKCDDRNLVWVIAHNMTEHKKFEYKLRQVYKMEAIQTLAKGIAHNFNNILASIMGFTELTMLDIPANSLSYSNLERLLKSVDRAKELVGQILTFTCQDRQGKKPVDIAVVVKNVLKLIKAGLCKNIEISQNIIACETVIMAMSMQMSELVMNLCVNSIEAMDEKGGKLEVTIDDEDIPERNNLSLPAGNYIRLTVSDTGCGIPDNIIDRIYDPFFTTKGLNQGTGMGLSVVYGIVKNCDGAIQVSSKVGKGTVFNLYFPKIVVEETQEYTDMITMPRGEETILFVDDEEFFLEVSQNMFERLGYKVITTNSSIDAMKIFSSSPEKFDLIMTDYGMIHMTGIELAKEAMKIRSDIPVILCTGFGDMITLEKVIAEGIKDLIMKPFGMKDISETVRKILDTHGKGQKKEKTANMERELGTY